MSVRRGLSTDARLAPGPPPVPTSRGPMPLRGRVIGGPPRAPPKRSSSLYTARARRPGGDGTGSDVVSKRCVAHGETLCRICPVADGGFALCVKESMTENISGRGEVGASSGLLLPPDDMRGIFPARHGAGAFAPHVLGPPPVSRAAGGPAAVAPGRGGGSSDGDEDGDGSEPTPRASCPYPAGTLARHCAPLPALKPPAVAMLDEVRQWDRMLRVGMGADVHRDYARETEAALHALREEMVALHAAHVEADEALLQAKAYHTAHMDNMRSEEEMEKRGHGREAEAETEDGELSPEWEAWRIEKGELLARKATLLQRHKEMRHHIRRGTNIKPVSGIATGFPGRRDCVERENENDGAHDSTSAGFSISGSHAVDDRALLELRLQLKECEVAAVKLTESHALLKEEQRERAREFEEEHTRLLRTAETTVRDTARARSDLEEQLGAAESLWRSFRENKLDAVAAVLGHGIAEARETLTRDSSHYNNNNNNSSGDSAAGGGRYRSRVASTGQSVWRPTALGDRVGRSVSAPVGPRADKTESIRQRCVEQGGNGSAENAKRGELLK